MDAYTRLANTSLGDVREEASRLTRDDFIEREISAGVPFGPFHQQRLLERAPERVRRHLRLAATNPYYVAAKQGFMSMDANEFPGASFTAVTASATETQLWTPIATWTPIPLGTLRSGGAWKVSCGGVFTSTATQGVLTWTPRAGQSATVATNVTLGASNATAPPASLTGQAWYAEFTMGCRNAVVAASGATCTGNGFATVQGAAAATGVMYVMGGTVAATVDNSINSGLVVDLTISVASQSYTCQWVALQSMN